MLPARRPFPDELACSAVFRCSRQFNIPTKRLARIYLGRDGWRPSFLGASPLQEMARLFRLPPEDLLWQHTVFPYATATLREEYYDRALANAFGSSLDARGLGAVTQNVSGGLAFRKYCRYCAEEERARYLTSYWHRSHNLPAVWVCERHGCFLWQSSIAVTSSGAIDKSMPHECSGQRIARSSPSQALLRVAQLSLQWLRRDRNAGSFMEPTEYRALAIANDWVSSDRPINLELLTKSLISTFSQRFLSNCGLPIGSALWAGLMLRPSIDVEFAPVKHALLQTVLGQPRPPNLPRLDHISSGPSGSSAKVLDDFYSRAAGQQLRKLIVAGDVVTTEAFLRSAGCWGTYKHRGHELPKLRAVVREFRGSNTTVKRLRPGKTLFGKAAREPSTMGLGQSPLP